MPGPDIQAQKEVAQALVPRAETSVVKPELQQALKASNELRQAAMGSDEDLDVVLKKQASNRPFEAARGLRYTETAIGNSSPNERGVRTDAGEITRYNTLKASVDVLTEYTNTGDISKVNTGERLHQVAQEQAMDAVLSVAKAIPQIESIFVDKNGNPIPETNIAARREIVKGLMNDPEFLQIVKQVANEKLDPEQARARLDALQTKQIESKRKYEEARVATARAESDHKTIETQLDTVTKALGSYEPGMVKDATSAAYALDQIETAIKALTGDGKQSLESLIAEQSAIVAEADTNMAPYMRNIATPGVNITDLQKSMEPFAEKKRDAEQNIAQARELMRQRKELLDEKASLEAKQAELQAQELIAQRAAEDAKRRESQAFADVNLLQGERVPLEADLVSSGSTSEVLAESARRYFAENYDKVKGEHDRVMADEKAKLQSEAEQKAYDALARIWHKPEDRGAAMRFLKGDRGFVINAEKVNTDFASLLAQPPTGGPDALRGLLVDSNNAPITLTDEQWGHVKGRVVQELIQRKLEAGGMKEGEARLIFNSSWGKDVIGKAMAENAKFNSEILGQMQAQGLIEGSDYDSIKKFADKHPVWSGLLMAILLGTLAVPASVVVGPMVAGAGAAGIGAGTKAASKII